MSATLEQSMSALAQANEVRFARVRLRNEIRAMSPAQGRRAIAELLRNPDPCMESEPVGRFLTWPARSGPVKADRWCALAGVNQLFRVAGSYNPSRHSQLRRGSLTASQRERLAAVVLEGLR